MISRLTKLTMMVATAACFILIGNGGCTLPDAPLLDSPLDPASLQYVADRPTVEWISRTSENTFWVFVTATEPYLASVHLERRGGNTREFTEIRSLSYRPQYGVSDTTTIIVDSVYTYRARVRTSTGVYSTYSVEKSIKARIYPS